MSWVRKVKAVTKQTFWRLSFVGVVLLLGMAMNCAAAGGSQSQATNTTPAQNPNAASPPANAPAQPTGPVWCDIGWRAGMLAASVLNKPFVAEIQNTNTRRLPLDKGTQFELTAEGWKLSADKTEMFSPPTDAGEVARDSAGRVVVKMPGSVDSMLSFGGRYSVAPGNLITIYPPYVPDWSRWSGTICDPVAGIMVQLGANKTYQENLIRLAPYDGPAHFGRQHNTRHRKWEDLGYKDMFGTRVHGYRWWTRRDPTQNFKDDVYEEVWISEDLQVDFAEGRTLGLTYGSAISQSILTNVRHVEPDPALFTLPPGYRKYKPPIGRRNRGAKSSQTCACKQPSQTKPQ